MPVQEPTQFQLRMALIQEIIPRKEGLSYRLTHPERITLK